MENRIPAFLLEKKPPPAPAHGRPKSGGRLKTPFVDKGLHQVAGIIKTGYIQWETASRDNFFQQLDARVKVLFLLFFVLIVSLKKDLMPEAVIGVFVLVLALAARLEVRGLYKRVLLFGFIFGFTAALPSAFNVITKGPVIFPVLSLSQPHSFWVFRIPREIGLTRDGVYGVAMLTLRVMNSVAISLFVLYTTPFPELIKALKVLKVPDGFLMIVALSYKYIFIFAKTVEDMHLAVKGRLAGHISNSSARGWLAGRLAFMFKKTRLRCEEIFKAMLGRGFSGGVQIFFYGPRRLRARDWLTGAAFFTAGVLFLLIGG